jgi:hypothetical protein
MKIVNLDRRYWLVLDGDRPICSKKDMIQDSNTHNCAEGLRPELREKRPWTQRASDRPGL